MRFCGADGTATGVELIESDAPAPAAFTALTASVYDVPFVSPVNVWLVVDAPLPGIVVHVPLSIWY